MEIAEGTVKYYPPLSYRGFCIHLFGWSLFYHKDTWTCDVQLYGPKREIDVASWNKYNTIYGMAWVATIFGVVIKSAIAKKAWG